jgi:cation diffusion facilitator CzcD-associated flavoprotein CzcO
MTKRILEADYLIVGSGAMGMAFTDVLLTETDASVVMLDRHAQPGGHWNDAYPFVRLHQPSAFYGVNSKPLAAIRSTQRAGTGGSTSSPPGARSSRTSTR